MMTDGVVLKVVLIGVLFTGVSVNSTRCEALDCQNASVVNAAAMGNRNKPISIESRGLYRNQEYGYSIRVPNHHRGKSAPPPAPQHGVKINLSGCGEDFIWVDGSYNAAEYPTPSQAAAVGLETIRNKGGEIQTVSESESRLDSLSAKLTTVHYRIKSSGEKRVEVYVIALRTFGNEDEQTGIIYSIGLSCREKRFERARDVFREVLSSWKMQRISSAK
jgi:hypothetical protein